MLFLNPTEKENFSFMENTIEKEQLPFILTNISVLQKTAFYDGFYFLSEISQF